MTPKASPCKRAKDLLFTRLSELFDGPERLATVASLIHQFALGPYP